MFRAVSLIFFLAVLVASRRFLALVECLNSRIRQNGPSVCSVLLRGIVPPPVGGGIMGVNNLVNASVIEISSKRLRTMPLRMVTLSATLIVSDIDLAT